MRKIAWWLWALTAFSTNAACNAETTPPVSGGDAGHAGSAAGAGGTGATPAKNGEGGTGDESWPHPEGGNENLAEQLIDGCIRQCSAFEAVIAHPNCEPGQRIRHGVLLDDDGNVPELVLNPVCPAQCEEELKDVTTVCAIEVEWYYCMAEAEFICAVDGGWGWNDCYDIPVEGCPPH